MPRPVRFSLLMMAFAAMLAGTRMLMASEPRSEGGLVVHEWGTFTSVAAPDGQSVDWRPLDGPQDLPCFVNRPATPLFKSLVPGATWLKTPEATDAPYGRQKIKRD